MDPGERLAEMAEQIGVAMHQTAQVRETLAQRYARMAEHCAGPAAVDYRRRADRLVELARRARCFAEQELATAERIRSRR